MNKKCFPWHEDAWNLARSALARGAHALLLHGPGGLGKRELALRIAAERLCETPQEGEAACGTCVSCRWLAAGTHPDFAMIEPLVDEDKPDAGAAKSSNRAAPIKIDQVRALRELLEIAPHRDRGKVVIVQPAESLNTAAANALLKSLEEPPAGTVFLLVSHQPAFLPPTVRSRCLAVAVRQGDAGAAAAWLENQGVADAALKLAWTGGAPLGALVLEDDPWWAKRAGLLERLASAPAEAVATAEAYRDLPPAVLLTWLQRWTFDLLLVRSARRVRYNADFADRMGPIASRLEPGALMSYHRLLLGWQRIAHHPLNPRLFLEQMLLRYASVAGGHVG